jgi:hypothetical protein
MTPTHEYGTFRFAGTSFQVEGTDNNGLPMTSFNEPFTMTVRYEEQDWQAAAIASEESLTLAYWNGSQWVNLLPCAGCSLNTTDNRLTILLDHLTEFALFGQAEPITPTPTATVTATPTEATKGYHIYLPLTSR